MYGLAYTIYLIAFFMNINGSVKFQIDSFQFQFISIHTKWKINQLTLIETRKSRDIQPDNDYEEKIP